MQMEENIEKETNKDWNLFTFYTQKKDRRPEAFFPMVSVAFCQAPSSMKIPGDGGSKVKLLSVEWGLDVSGTSQCKQKQATTGTFD